MSGSAADGDGPSVTVSDLPVGRSEPGHPPRALIVTLFGLYARESGGWLSVATLVRLLGQLGVDETAVRSSISRLKRRAVIHPERVDGAAGYRLDEHTHHLLDLGDRRIFHPRRARLGDGWLLAVFSVPESQRERRHRLRVRLTWLGFGTVGPGIWVAPSHLEAEARETLTHEGLDPFVDLFRAEHLGFGDLRCEVSSWWDLVELDRLYADFDADHSTLLRAWLARPRSRSTELDRDAFVDYVRTLTTWRRLPYLDPGLPLELLPTDWSGAHAEATFDALRGRLAAPAHRFATRVRRQTLSESPRPRRTW